jgi:hypothetical protein
MPEILGVDIGGVVIQSSHDGEDTSFFGERYLETPEIHGAIDAIAALAKGRFAGGNVHVISKCGKTVEKHTLEWLAHHDFEKRTGIDLEHMHFCRTRPEKAPICRKLGVTHFVDDRLEVLGYLESVPNRFLFQPDVDELVKNVAALPLVTRVESWAELFRLLV